MTEPVNTEGLNLEAIIAATEANPDLQAQLQAQFVNPSTVQSFLGTEEGEKVIAPIKDQYATKAIEGWKNKNLDRIIQEKVAELNPPETKEQRELMAMQQRLAAIEKDKQALEQKAVASDELSKVGLPTSFTDFVVGDSVEVTKHRVQKLEIEISNFVKNNTDSALKDYGAKTTPSVVDTAVGSAGQTPPDPYDMSIEEATELAETNPAKFKQLFGE